MKVDLVLPCGSVCIFLKKFLVAGDVCLKCSTWSRGGLSQVFNIEGKVSYCNCDLSISRTTSILELFKELSFHLLPNEHYLGEWK